MNSKSFFEKVTARDISDLSEEVSKKIFEEQQVIARIQQDKLAEKKRDTENQFKLSMCK